MSPPTDGRPWKPHELAAWLRVDTKTVQRWCDAGLLEHWRTPGGHRRIPYTEIERLIAQMETV